MKSHSNPKQSIGELSRQTGCKVETIRYYERIEILPLPARTEGGHRVYNESHLKRLNFVLRARRLGFSLADVRRLLELSDGEGETCEQVERMATDRLTQVRNKMADLVLMEGVLDGMVKECRLGKTPQCPLIETLFTSEQAQKS